MYIRTNIIIILYSVYIYIHIYHNMIGGQPAVMAVYTADESVSRHILLLDEITI